MARVTLTPQAAEQLEALNNPIHGRLLRLLVRLEEWPKVSGAKRLTGDLAGRYRLRTGDYRVQFHMVADSVIVEKIGHRDGFYDEQ
jgi:mRNA-degrading endonuclease RelE of RelBE toxin-antitoxin system